MSDKLYAGFGAEAAQGTAARRLLAPMFAGLLGVLILFGVGFAGPAAIHNAAHDTRHAFTFPCH